MEPCEALKTFTRNWHITVVHTYHLDKSHGLILMQLTENYSFLPRKGLGKEGQ